MGSSSLWWSNRKASENCTALLLTESNVTWPTSYSTTNFRHITTTVVHTIMPVGASQSPQRFEGGYYWGGAYWADPCYDHLRPHISQAQQILPQLSQAACIYHHHNTTSPSFCKGPQSDMPPGFEGRDQTPPLCWLEIEEEAGPINLILSLPDLIKTWDKTLLTFLILGIQDFSMMQKGASMYSLTSPRRVWTAIIGWKVPRDSFLSPQSGKTAVSSWDTWCPTYGTVHFNGLVWAENLPFMHSDHGSAKMKRIPLLIEVIKG